MNPGDQGLNQASQAARELAVSTDASTDPAFNAFYGRHQAGWVGYAYIETGSREAAERIVDGLTAHMAKHWYDLRTAERAAEHAWKALKSTVAHWLDEHAAGSAFLGTAAFDRAARRVLARSGERFAEMEESIGLYSAISRLPECQRNTIILRYVLGYDDSQTAWMLDMTENAVRVNVCHAKKRIANELGLPRPTRTEA